MEQPLVWILVVFAAAIIWVAFVFIMLNALDRVRRKAQREARREAERTLRTRGRRRQRT